MEKATVGMMVATATAVEAIGTEATAAAAAESSALQMSNYLIIINTVEVTDTTSPATITVPPATTSSPTIASWQQQQTPCLETPSTKSVPYGPAHLVGLR